MTDRSSQASSWLGETGTWRRGATPDTAGAGRPSWPEHRRQRSQGLPELVSGRLRMERHQQHLACHRATV